MEPRSARHPGPPTNQVGSAARCPGGQRPPDPHGATLTNTDELTAVTTRGTLSWFMIGDPHGAMAPNIAAVGGNAAQCSQGALMSIVRFLPAWFHALADYAVGL